MSTKVAYAEVKKDAPNGKQIELVEEGIKKEEKKVEEPKKRLSFIGLLIVLKPFFWPQSGTDGAFVNRIRSTSTWLAVGASKACSLLAPYYLSNATNFLVKDQYLQSINSVITYCALRFGSSAFKELQGVLYVKVKQQAAIDLAETTFSHVHKLSLNWHITKQTGSVIKSMDRGTEAANTLVTYLFLFLIPALSECVAVIILFFASYKQWDIGLVTLAGVTIYIFFTIVITQWRKKYRESQNKHDNDFHNKATDSIINYETVKYFTAEQHEIVRFKEGVVNFQQFNSMISISLSVLNSTQQFILMMTLAGTMLLAGRAVHNGQMSLGGWVAVQAWIAQIFVPLNFLGSVYQVIFQAFIDVQNLSELLSESPDVIDEVGATPIPLSKTIHEDKTVVKDPNYAMVEFQNVNFHYPSQPAEKGIKNLSFKVPVGSITAFVGKTGAGKTTISRLLFRFYDVHGGKILIGGFDQKKHTQRSVRELIGIIPQDTVLFNDTILYNVQYGNKLASMDQIVEATKAAQIYDFIMSLPENWNTIVGERGLKLSGGEKQRVSIARCLLKNPPIVILDEATSALDTITENSVQAALNKLGDERTVLIIAHRLSTIKNASNIIVLDNGIVLESGSHEELLSNSNSEYSKLWAMQSKDVNNVDEDNTK